MKTKEKAVLSPEEKAAKKKARHKKAGKIISIIVSVIVLFVIVTSIITVVGVKSNLKKAEAFPKINTVTLDAENFADGYWNIHTDHGIKIVQLTDVHFGGGWMSLKKDSMAMNAVASMLKAEKPDFVIVTGDIAYPVPFQAGTFNNKNGAKLFATLMESLGIYWTVGYGNHDTELYSFFTREEITDFYSSGDYPHCLVQPGPADVDGCGNQMFNIINSDDIITRTLFVMDSHSYIDGDFLGIMWKYDSMHENQIAWYKQMIEENQQHNHDVIAAMSKKDMKRYAGFDAVPSSVFQHIPLTEYKDAWNEYVENGKQNTENVKYNYGTVGESGQGIYCGIHEDNFFETMLEIGSTDTVFCGHDHLNNFSLNYKGINLNYGYSVDYLAYPGIYKLGSQRGCTVIKIDEDGNIKHHLENYYQDKYISDAREDVTMQTLGE
ncbi:MAG: metallophosphoesterase [Clostridia bacterium]|nr:metallophosphoesterase [Clostridia bacterium]